MLRALIAASLVCAAGSSFAGAQEFTANFSEMGKIALVADGVEMSLLVPHNKKSGRPFARALPLGNKVTVNIAAYTPSPEGLPGNPMISLDFDLVNDTPSRLSVRYVDALGMKLPMVARTGIGQADFTSFERRDGNAISATVRARVFRVDTSESMTDPTIVHGAAPVEIELSLDVSFAIPN